MGEKCICRGLWLIKSKVSFLTIFTTRVLWYIGANTSFSYRDLLKGVTSDDLLSYSTTSLDSTARFSDFESTDNESSEGQNEEQFDLDSDWDWSSSDELGEVNIYWVVYYGWLLLHETWRKSIAIVRHEACQLSVLGIAQLGSNSTFSSRNLHF